jgi:hypothetical protein
MVSRARDVGICWCCGELMIAAVQLLGRVGVQETCGFYKAAETVREMMKSGE